MCWGLIRSWLSEETKMKVHIMASESVWRPKLANLLEGGEAALPDLFGGPATTERPDGQPVPLHDSSTGLAKHDARGARVDGSGGASPRSEGQTPIRPSKSSLWRRVKKTASPRKLLGRRKGAKSEQLGAA